jgi:hypothetical protein
MRAALVKLQAINQKEPSFLVFLKKRAFIMSPLILYIMKAVAEAKKKKKRMKIQRNSRRPTNNAKLKTLNLP